MTGFQWYYRGILSVIRYRAGQVIQYLAKIGSSIKKPFPSAHDLQEWKEIFAEAKADPDFTVVTHYENESMSKSEKITEETEGPELKNAYLIGKKEEVKKPRRGGKRTPIRKVKRNAKKEGNEQ